MQLFHEHKPVIAIGEYSKNMSLQEASSHYFEVKEKRSSDGSILLMNPVASGDNVANDLNCAQKLKEELPSLVPCCEGRELQINEDLVRSGLSAISVKHETVIQCLSMSNACEKMQVPPGLVKHRNSFRCLHRPDLKRVPYLRRLSPDELELLFRGYADIPKRGSAKSENEKEAAPANAAPEKNVETRDLQEKVPYNKIEGNIGPLHPIPEAKSRLEDVPAGMRLHGARARLYTSVLAGNKTGDQLDNSSTKEEDDIHVDDPIPEDEVLLHEELQIILPPRCDDVTAESSIASSATCEISN